MTGCGAWDGSSDSDSGSGSGAAPAPATELTIAVQPEGEGGPTNTWTLTCEPTGGTLPRPAEACSRLSAEALRPLPEDAICTQIYGGPQTAHVTGHVGTTTMDTRFSRTNGCAIHHWDSVSFLFPVKI
jgi:Subtilisin inhibitor-like